MIETLSYMRKPQTPKKPPYAIESVDHALVVIQLLRDAGAARLVEIAREIGVSASTAHRILAMLVFRGFALQDDDRRYLPGPSIGVAPTTTSHNRLLMDVSRRRVEALTVATGETSNLMIRIGANARILYTAEGHHTLRVHDRRGAVLPARHASGGKALLAELDTQALQRLYLRRNHVDEPLSLDAFAALQAQLARIRMDGFALNIEETEAGIGAVGVCVRAADGTAIALTLVKLAQLVADLPEVRELDLNPLLADTQGVIPVDARVAVALPCVTTRGRRGHPRFAIRPYPSEWERELALPGGLDAIVRPVRPEDEELFRAFFAQVTPDDLRLRFFAPVRDISQAFIARLIQLDYARAMAFVAIDRQSGAMLGAVRLHIDANFTVGEYGILVRSDLKGKGLGWALMQLMIEYARAEGLATVEGQVLRENTTMLAMCQQLGFAVTIDPDSSDLCIVRLKVPAAN